MDGVQGWWPRSKHWGGRHAEDDHTQYSFTDMPFVGSVNDVPYEKLFAHLIPKLRSNCFSSTDADLILWYGSDHVQKEWFILNHEYWAWDIDIEIPLGQCIAGKVPLFVSWHNVEVVSIAPLHPCEVYVTVPDW